MKSTRQKKEPIDYFKLFGGFLFSLSMSVFFADFAYKGYTREKVTIFLAKPAYGPNSYVYWHDNPNLCALYVGLWTLLSVICLAASLLIVVAILRGKDFNNNEL